jgi:hypothetical protein
MIAEADNAPDKERFNEVSFVANALRPNFALDFSQEEEEKDSNAKIGRSAAVG